MKANPYNLRGYWLSRIVRELESKTHEALARFKISGPQFRLFALVASGKENTVRGLASALQVDGAAVSRLVDKLAQAGFVVREPDVDDKRSVIVVATDPGQRLINDINAAVTEAEGSFFSKLSNKQLKLLDAALGTLVTANQIGRQTKTGNLRPQRRK